VWPLKDASLAAVVALGRVRCNIVVCTYSQARNKNVLYCQFNAIKYINKRPAYYCEDKEYTYISMQAIKRTHFSLRELVPKLRNALTL